MAIRVSVTIPKVQEAKEAGKPFTFYMMNVTVEQGAHAELTVVPRRYRDFESLIVELGAEFPMIFDPKQNPNPPALPGKKWFGNMDPSVVQDRRIKLQEFMQECLEHECIVLCQTMGDFLQL
eukprot:TRINITY_DN8003_c0_g1_i5.p1 TRINITY_DN8003_c0_g1~~TRINITY_DN8003_c0_g1_i5.p1  ORF type:complete len:122 (+),score=32.33 TRINITY_DN8003_c0_g1_i5:195-560(+)